MGSRVILSVVLGLIFTFGYGWVVFGILLEPVFMSAGIPDGGMNPPEVFMDKMWVMVLGYLLLCVLLARMARQGGARQGAATGLSIGLVLCGLEMVNFAVYAGSYTLLVAVLCVTVGQWVATGALMGVVRR